MPTLPPPHSVLEAVDAGPKAMRLFDNIADRWHLSRDERHRLLQLSEGEYAQRLVERLPLTEDLIFRAGYCVHIYSALQVIFQESERADTWLRRKHVEGPLSPGSALDHMLSGDLEDLRLVSEYLRRYTE